MRLTIRVRLVLWLMLAILPMICAGFLFARQANSTITERAESDLVHLLELEIGRVESVLDQQSATAERIATSSSFVNAVEMSVLDDQETSAIRSKRIGVELRDALGSGENVEDLMVVDREGMVLDKSDGFSWQPADRLLVAKAMDSRKTVFGDAFVNPDSDERLGLVVPIVTTDGSVLGALLVENRLAPVVGPSQLLEGFGESSEALIIQRGSNSMGQPITLRRFERSAAFSAMIDPSGQTPSARSLDTSEVLSFTGRDYRGAEIVAAVGPIDRAGWGMVVKIDQDEAFAVAKELNRFALVAFVLTIIVVLLGWVFRVRPLGPRLRAAASAAHRVAGGDYESLIGDTAVDEIGDLSRGIDQLAKDLSVDIAARKLAESQLWFQANHDSLTGLKNRQHAQEFLEGFKSENSPSNYSVLFLDLDGFKEINDTHGHGIGDEVLVSLAQRLMNALPQAALVSRWGGDEFLVVLLEDEAEDIADVATHLGRLVREPVATRRGQHTVGASIGFASSVNHVDGADVVLAADADMFLAKHNRRSTRTVSPAAIRLVEEALVEDRVLAFFQPVVELDENGETQLVGAEALVRIRGIDGATVPPMDFLPALGSNELAGAIDARVMARAFQDLGLWHQKGIVPPNFRVALNVGPASINDPSLVDRLHEAMELYCIEPRWVLIEIPETVETVEPETLARLREIGVGLAIDDVGVAYSNLERMVDLNADIAKLDRRWIPDLATAEQSKFEVLLGLVDQCRSLGLDVIAEGVETEEQVQMLREIGVGVFQGFFFGRPVSAFDFERTWCSNFGSAISPAATDVDGIA